MPASVTQLASILPLGILGFSGGAMCCFGIVLAVTGRSPVRPFWGTPYSEGEIRAMGVIYSVWGPLLSLQGLFTTLLLLAPPDATLGGVLLSGAMLVPAIGIVVCACLLIVVQAHHAGYWPHQTR
jgi:hypothetical protein